MKAFKIIIVAVLVAALGFGVYMMVTADPSGGTEEEKTGQGASDDGGEGEGKGKGEGERGITIPEDCDLDWARQYISSVFDTIPARGFKTLEKRRKEMRANFAKQMEDVPAKCMETLDLILRNRYQVRFIKMADSEFNDSAWPDYAQIKKMNTELLNELSGGSNELKRIAAICKEYDKVTAYNSRVRNQAYQRPSSVRDHWNIPNARKLISETPSASSPVDHTKQYGTSRQAKVKELLYNGHVAFLERLVELARDEFSTRPEQKYDISNTVSTEIRQFRENAGSLYGKGPNTVRDVADRIEGKLKKYFKEI